ncbi:unnamed protein product [Clonostachys solani]|uniref:BTB domain-containing protein n=1 Tax=Clonostachys solani TaxID=160281 RepID=A0A9N9WBI5_9HYPO|nr:unnamed protein product [Clonostachys solani]
MKPIPVEALASSDLYRFIVGPEKKVYHVHSAVLANHSPALDAMVNGGLRESVEQTVDWTDVEPTAFLDEDVLEVDIREEERDIPPYCILDELWIKFNALPLGDSEQWLPRQPKSVSSRVVVNSYSDLLIHHARVCVLADKYLVPPLKQLALEALRKELSLHLCDLEKIPEIAPDVIALLHYCFNNPAPEKLRKLVSLFTACIITDLWKCEGVQDLLESSGELSTAVLGCIATNLDAMLFHRFLGYSEIECKIKTAMGDARSDISTE